MRGRPGAAAGAGDRDAASRGAFVAEAPLGCRHLPEDTPRLAPAPSCVRLKWSPCGACRWRTAPEPGRAEGSRGHRSGQRIEIGTMTTEARRRTLRLAIGTLLAIVSLSLSQLVQLLG